MGWWDNKKSTDILGDTHFIVFYGCVLSRLAYLKDDRFFECYKKIFGPIIPIEFMKQIDAVPDTQLENYYDDENIFQLKTTSGTKLQVGIEVKTVDHTYTDKEFKGQTKKLIDIIGMQFPANIDALLNEVESYNKDDYKKLIQEEKPIQQQQDPSENQNIRYISIATSNYGEIYIVADKRTPNTLYISFRGTYSAKTALMYLQTDTVKPYTLKNGDGFLLGMYKTVIESFHTIIEAMVEMSKFLGTTQPIKIFSCGHSLGAGLASLFSYIWQDFIKHPSYEDQRYKVFSPNIICLSYGCPRVFNHQVAEKFCKYSTDKPLKIFYERVVSKGDPVAGVPKKSQGFEHPCSSNPQLRMEISEECENNVHQTLFPSLTATNIGTKEPITCKDNTGGLTFAMNMQDHTGYMGISFMKGLDLIDLLNPANAVPSNSMEIKRENGDTVCRLVMWNGSDYVTVFFNVVKLRVMKSNTSGRQAMEDLKMSPELFSELMKNMKSYQAVQPDGKVKAAPLDWNGYLYTPTTYREMPPLELGEKNPQEVSQQIIGGRKSRKKKRKTRKQSRKRKYKM